MFGDTDKGRRKGYQNRELYCRLIVSTWASQKTAGRFELNEIEKGKVKKRMKEEHQWVK